MRRKLVHVAKPEAHGNAPPCTRPRPRAGPGCRSFSVSGDGRPPGCCRGPEFPRRAGGAAAAADGATLWWDDATGSVGRASASSISCAPSRSRSATMSTAAQVGMPTALHDDYRCDDRNEQATDGGGRGVLRRSATGTRLGAAGPGERSSYAPFANPAQRRRHDPQAQGVLRRGAGDQGAGPIPTSGLYGGEAGSSGAGPARGRRRSTGVVEVKAAGVGTSFGWRCVAHRGGRSRSAATGTATDWFW